MRAARSRARSRATQRSVHLAIRRGFIPRRRGATSWLECDLFEGGDESGSEDWDWLKVRWTRGDSSTNETDHLRPNHTMHQNWCYIASQSQSPKTFTASIDDFTHKITKKTLMKLRFLLSDSSKEVFVRILKSLIKSHHDEWVKEEEIFMDDLVINELWWKFLLPSIENLFFFFSFIIDRKEISSPWFILPSLSPLLLRRVDKTRRNVFLIYSLRRPGFNVAQDRIFITQRGGYLCVSTCFLSPRSAALFFILAIKQWEQLHERPIAKWIKAIIPSSKRHRGRAERGSLMNRLVPALELVCL